MSEPEFYIAFGGLFALAYLFGLWDESRRKAKALKRHRQLHSNLNIIRNLGTNETLEQTYERSRPMDELVTKHLAR